MITAYRVAARRPACTITKAATCVATSPVGYHLALPSSPQRHATKRYRNVKAYPCNYLSEFEQIEKNELIII
jgi:hypothetical protein